jgi:ABC-2 type transport system permease protein
MVGMEKKVKKSNLRRQAIVQLIMLLGIIVFMNVISGYMFTRLDLTSDKRFTLSDASKKLVKNLKDVVFVKVYLEGDFAPGFMRLRNSTMEMLDELRSYSGGKIEYEFIDPSAATDEKERNKLYAQLYQKGIQPSTLEERTNEGLNRKYIFPGALVSYSNQEIAVQLLKDQLGAAPEVMLNNSVQNLEYEICNAIRKVTNPMRPLVGFVNGHGELSEEQTGDIIRTLQSSYDVKRVKIDSTIGILNEFKAIIIAKPDSAIPNKDKFIIDQFIMKGGKVIWLIDPMQVTMDSLAKTGNTMALARDLNIDDMLFRYGVRVNYDLAQDMMCSMIPVVTGFLGNQPKQELKPWYFFPVMTPVSTHPIVNNLNAIKGEFTSSIDLVDAPGTKQTVLLSTSQYSKLSSAPVRVSLGIMEFKPDPKMFPVSNIPVAVLLEGTFTSAFKNRILSQEMLNSKELGYRDSSVNNQMIVISDGDIIRNDVSKGNPMPLGYDKFTRTTFGNKSFIQNAVDYLCDDSGLMSVRNKVIKLRLIDPNILEKDNQLMKVTNAGLPVLLVVIFGLVKSFMRRRKYKN